MKRKYDLPEENQGTDRVEEPAVEYQNKIASPCQYTEAELRERVIAATKHVEEGTYYTEDNLDDYVLS